ncbi:MAG: substrate-binding domain-containing protein, partial [Clostridiales bacterium]|nr:substrate-binding domain-containing protein [Clostridiales bacterium]
MKKFVKLLVSSALVAAMAIGVCACGGSNPTQAPTPTEGPATEAPATEAPKTDDALIKVGIINNDPNESGYRTANDRDMKATFTKENGYEASFFYSLKNEEQIAAAQKFIQDEVDYLLISAAGTSGWDGVLEQAQKAGIKVILFDRTIDADESLYEASIVSDMAKEGEQAVSWLASQGLSEYKIIHIQGVMGSSAQIGRSGA